MTGVFKSGAVLLGLTARIKPFFSLGSCNVLVAGANDDVNSQNDLKYRNIEEKILARGAAKAVVATQSMRQDLLCHHPSDNQTAAVDYYIEELRTTQMWSYWTSMCKVALFQVKRIASDNEEQMASVETR